MRKILSKTKSAIKNSFLDASYLFSKKYPSDFSRHHVILHFSYHKCLTNYYNQIMERLSREFGITHVHYKSNVKAFENTVIEEMKRGIYSVNNYSHVDFNSFPDYRGSHFVRDPRDLIVSGYKYHLWCNEIWCNDPDFDWNKIISNPLYAEHIESDKANFPKNVSYKTYLNTLTQEKGILLEMLWRERFLNEMLAWNYQNPNIIELKYEEIIGNEAACFEKIFRHYNFHPKIIDRGLVIVDSLSLKNRKKGSANHIRKGTWGQWQTEFSDLNKRLFENSHGKLIDHLGYRDYQDKVVS